jgi:hypothetical protein
MPKDKRAARASRGAFDVPTAGIQPSTWSARACRCRGLGFILLTLQPAVDQTVIVRACPENVVRGGHDHHRADSTW